MDDLLTGTFADEATRILYNIKDPKERFKIKAPEEETTLKILDTINKGTEVKLKKPPKVPLRFP